MIVVVVVVVAAAGAAAGFSCYVDKISNITIIHQLITGSKLRIATENGRYFCSTAIFVHIARLNVPSCLRL